MPEDFAEIRAILDQLANRLEALEGPTIDLDELDDLDPGYFEAEVNFLDGAASILAQYGARLRERGNVLSVRYLLGDIAWGIDWLLAAGALADRNAWQKAGHWFAARANDAPDPVTMLLPEKKDDVLGFLAALERVCWLGQEMIAAERGDRDGVGLTATEAIKVVEKVVRHQLGARLSSVVPRYDGDKLGARQPWPVIQILADYLRTQYTKLGEATHAGSLGQTDTPTGDVPPISLPE